MTICATSWTATLTPSLLGLGPELQETILGHQPQDERRRTLHLVCKQLDIS